MRCQENSPWPFSKLHCDSWLLRTKPHTCSALPKAWGPRPPGLCRLPVVANPSLHRSQPTKNVSHYSPTHLFTKQTLITDCSELHPEEWAVPLPGDCCHGAGHPRRPRCSERTKFKGREVAQIRSRTLLAASQLALASGSPLRLMKKSSKQDGQLVHAPLPSMGDLKLLGNPRDAAGRTSPS